MIFSSKNNLQRGTRAREFKVDIFSRTDFKIHGKLVHLVSGETVNFSSFLELIYLIGDKLEKLDLVQPSTEMRSFYKLHALKGREGRISNLNKIEMKTNPKEHINGKPSLLIRILLRQNATWQGEIHWLNNDKVIRFRSLLEMIMLIQEAIEISGEPKAEYEFRSWSEEIEMREKQTVY